MTEFDFNSLYEDYGLWKEKTISNRLFKPADIEKLVLNLKNESNFSVDKLGESVEGRSIYGVQWGQGAIKILLWSQMHGDEPTATMAFMDLFNFLKSQEHNRELSDFLLNHLSLHFIPMLNPDGADKYQRRNALEIDLNRDALRLQTPEAQILAGYREKIHPAWAFNMHDQRKYYTVGNSLETATISFLAPSFDVNRSINDIRSDAMRVIAEMHECLQEFIPGKIAKYTDKFYPRSFGDTFQKFGVRSILVESGGLKGDPEKQYIRKLHFILLLNGLQSIASNSYKNQDLSTYQSIPENSEFLHDLIIRNVNLRKNSKRYTVDLAFKTEEIAHEEHWDFYHQSSLIDIGDLSTHHGYKELDGEGLEITTGKLYPTIFNGIHELDKKKATQILKDGYTDVRVKDLPKNAALSGLPLRMIPEKEKPSFELLVGQNASIFLQENGINKFAVVNGFLINLD